MLVLNQKETKMSPIALIGISVGLLMKPILWLFNKIIARLNIQKVPADFIEKNKDLQKPKFYQIFIITFYALFIFFMVASALFFPFFVQFIQKNIANGGWIYFYPGISFGSVMTFFLLFVSGLLFGAAIFFLIANPFIPKVYKTFLIKEHIKGGFPYDFIAHSKLFLAMGITIFLALIPFIYLSMHNFEAIYPDKIVYNSFLSLKDKVYAYDEVSEVQVKPYLEHTTDKIGARIYFTLRDRREFDLVSYDKDEILAIYNALKRYQVKTTITKPTPEAIRRIQEKCTRIQEAFYAAFKLDYPVIEKQDCSYKRISPL